MKPKIIILAALLVLVALPSCTASDFPGAPWNSQDAAGDKGDKGTGFDEPVNITDLVTVKISADGIVYLQYHEYKLLPETALNYTRQTRAIAEVHINPRQQGDYWECMVKWIEPLETVYYNMGGESSVPPTGVLGSPSSNPGGNNGYDVVWGDGFDIVSDDSLTRLEDGYLTIRYRTWWGEHPVQHNFSIRNTSDGPFVFRIVQNSQGDAHDVLSDALMCFDITSLANIINSDTTITINWKKLDGSYGSKDFEYKAGK